MAQRTQTDRSTEIAVAIAPVLTRHEISLLAAAADALALTLDTLDRVQPTDEARDNAETLRFLVETFRSAALCHAMLGGRAA